MRVVLAGASGLIGTALRESFAADGHTVIRLVRREPAAPDELRWDPEAAPNPALAENADVLVNLAGAPLGARRWSRGYRDVIRRSRVNAAHTLATATASAEAPPRVMISASGMRFYGVDRGDEELDESAGSVPDGFLPVATREWEAATGPASDAGIRVCHLRLSLVVSRDGGFLPRLLPPFRAGLGGTLGSGREFWSHISLSDAVRAIRFLAAEPDTAGPYNITAPHPVRSRQFATALARAVHRPVALRLPIWPLRVALGQVAPEVLGSLRVVPNRLTEAGFTHRHPDIASVLSHALAPTRVAG